MNLSKLLFLPAPRWLSLDTSPRQDMSVPAVVWTGHRSLAHVAGVHKEVRRTDGKEIPDRVLEKLEGVVASSGGLATHVRSRVDVWLPQSALCVQELQGPVWYLEEDQLFHIERQLHKEIERATFDFRTEARTRNAKNYTDVYASSRSPGWENWTSWCSVPASWGAPTIYKGSL